MYPPVRVVLGGLAAKTARGEHEEREALPLQRQVGAHGEGCAVPAAATQVHLVLVVDHAVAVLVLVAQVAGLGCLAQLLLGSAGHLGIALEEAQALIAPDGVELCALAVLVGVGIARVVALRGLGVVPGQVGTHAHHPVVGQLLAVVDAEVEAVAQVVVEVGVGHERSFRPVGREVARIEVVGGDDQALGGCAEVRCLEGEALLEQCALQGHAHLLALDVVEALVGTALRGRSLLRVAYAPAPPRVVVVVEVGRIHAVVLDVDVLAEQAVRGAELQVVEDRALHEGLTGDVPAQGAAVAPALAVALGQLGAVQQGRAELGIVAVSIVVRCHQTGIDVARPVILARPRLLVAVGQQHGTDVVHIGERAVVVEVSIEVDGLAVRRAAYALLSRVAVNVLLGDRGDHLLAIVVAPLGDVDGIGVGVAGRIGRSIIDGKHCREGQTLGQAAEVEVDAQRELEVAAVVLARTSGIAVGNDVGVFIADGIGRRSDEATVKQACRTHQVGRSLVERVEVRRGDEAHHAVGTQRGSIGPEVGVGGRTGAVERHVGIGKGRDPVRNLHIDVAAHVQSVGVVVLRVAVVQVVARALIADVGVVVGAVAAATELSHHLRAVIGLLEVVARIEVHVGIAIGVRTGVGVVDSFVAVLLGQAVVHQGLVVEGHVLGGTEVLGERLGDVPSRVGRDLDLQVLVVTALGGDQDGALGGTAAVEHHGLCALHEGHLCDLVRLHVVGIAGHTVNEHQIVGLAPERSAVEAGDVALHIVEAVGVVVLG